MVEAAKETRPTAYHALEQNGGHTAQPTFRLVNRDVPASSAEAAVRAHAAMLKETSEEGSPINGPGTYIAVPSRSWKPVTVTAETKTVLKLS